jgi:hypothetical protein
MAGVIREEIYTTMGFVAASITTKYWSKTQFCVCPALQVIANGLGGKEAFLATESKIPTSVVDTVNEPGVMIAEEMVFPTITAPLSTVVGL